MLSFFIHFAKTSKIEKKSVDKVKKVCYNNQCCWPTQQVSANGSLAQLGERLPYKQDVTGSSPVTPTKYTL